jgi:hypothetical protein
MSRSRQRRLLAGTGAVGAGVWLGVVVGLATRPRRQQHTRALVWNTADGRAPATDPAAGPDRRQPAT